MKLIQLVSYICVLGASMVLGNWFLTELRRARAARKPWYSPYLSVPGILILAVVLLLPIIAFIL
jgi:hypothetical protein